MRLLTLLMSSLLQAQVKASREQTGLRLAQGAAVAGFTVLSMFVLSFWVGTCVNVPEWHESSYGFTFYCENGTASPDSLYQQTPRVRKSCLSSYEVRFHLSI